MSPEVTARISPNRYAIKSIRTPDKNDATTSPKARPACADTPNRVSDANPRPES